MTIKSYLIAACLSFVLFSSIVTAQDDKIDGLAFDTEPLREEKTPYFAIAGGYTGSFFFSNLDDLNSALKTAGFGMSDEFSAPIYLSGVQGFTGIVIVPNMRVGFHSQSGMQKISNDIVISDKSYTRQLEYSINMNSLSFDYAITIAKSFAIIPGVSAGWGRLSLESSQAESELDWTKFTPTPYDLNFMQRAEASFWLIEPNVNIEFALTNFLMLRANGGYTMSFMNDWEMNRTATLKNVPDGINGTGFHFQFGVFLGLFNY